MEESGGVWAPGGVGSLWAGPESGRCLVDLRAETGADDRSNLIEHPGRPHSHTPRHRTVDLLDAPQVVVRQLEVVRLHPLVEGSHDGQGVVGVL